MIIQLLYIVLAKLLQFIFLLPQRVIIISLSASFPVWFFYKPAPHGREPVNIHMDGAVHISPLSQPASLYMDYWLLLLPPPKLNWKAQAVSCPHLLLV